MLFEAYDVLPAPLPQRPPEPLPAPLNEFVFRFETGGTRQGLEWLLPRLQFDELDLGQLLALAVACRRLLPDGTGAQELVARIVDRPTNSAADIALKVTGLYRLDRDGEHRGAITDGLRQLLASSEHHINLSLRKTAWLMFNDGEDELIIRLCRDIQACVGALQDAELCYIFALALDRRCSNADATREIIGHLNAALAGGFDGAWIRLHRGRLKLVLGERDGVEDLRFAVAQGGDAAREAKALLANDGVAGLWRSFFAGDHDAVVGEAGRMLGEGETDPAIHYVLGLSLHDGLRRLHEARSQYDAALAAGFEGAWVWHHRGRLRLEMGDQGGVEDLRFAVAQGGDGGEVAAKMLAGLAGGQPSAGAMPAFAFQRLRRVARSLLPTRR